MTLAPVPYSLFSAPSHLLALAELRMPNLTAQPKVSEAESPRTQTHASENCPTSETRKPKPCLRPLPVDPGLFNPLFEEMTLCSNFMVLSEFCFS